jgi:hypothetical protein
MERKEGFLIKEIGRRFFSNRKCNLNKKKNYLLRLPEKKPLFPKSGSIIKCKINLSKKVRKEVKNYKSLKEHNFAEFKWKKKPNNLRTKTINNKILDTKFGKLLLEGKIEKIKNPKNLIDYFIIPKKGGKNRIVFDFRDTNKYIINEGVYLPQLKDIKEAVRKFEYAALIDLTSGYHHVRIKKKDQKYFSFKWKKSYYCWKVLPFGLNVAPAIFQKFVNKKFVDIENVIWYLDDALVLGNSITEVKDTLKQISSRCKREGISINIEKSSFIPKRKIVYLGRLLDFKKKEISLTKEKKENLVKLIKRKNLNKKKVLRILGKLAFAGLDMQKFKEIYKKVGKVSKKILDHVVKIPITMRKKLLKNVNFKIKLNKKTKEKRKEKIAFTDASPWSGGINIGNDLIVIKFPKGLQKKININWKEALIFSLAIKLGATKIFSDNKNLIDLQNKKLKVDFLRKLRNIVERKQIDSQYIESNKNILADRLSRQRKFCEINIKEKKFDDNKLLKRTIIGKVFFFKSGKAGIKLCWMGRKKIFRLNNLCWNQIAKNKEKRYYVAKDSIDMSAKEIWSLWKNKV